MIVVVYFIFRLQGVLPLNPAHIEGMEPTLAFNTAISFMADTNLQHYSGENGLSYLSQLIGITFLMFAAPATTLALVMAFIRGLAGKELGNFFVDFTRALTRVFLPIAFMAALVFVALGVPQTLDGQLRRKRLMARNKVFYAYQLHHSCPLRNLEITAVDFSEPTLRILSKIQDK